MKRSSLVLLVLISGCGGKDDAASIAAVAAGFGPECAGDMLPAPFLECTGLYSNIQTKTIAAGVKNYVPAVPLWADGAEKMRYILLPAGTKIDASNPNEWTFPIGTKVWKEFSRGGKRVETRLYEKRGAGDWVHAAYKWSADGTAAPVFKGGTFTGPDGKPYHIPTYDECEDCHRGRTDRILGFEQVSLGLSTALGVTLADLVRDHLITPEPALTSLEIGEDSTGVAAGPLAWIHINCGTTCHNDNSNAMAYGAKMHLRLDPTELDGRPPTMFESLTTTIDQPANTPTFKKQIRIIPGDPNGSLLVQLILSRQADGGNYQMPPIATQVVDDTDAFAVAAWVAKMPSMPAADGTAAGGTGGAATATRDAGLSQ